MHQVLAEKQVLAESFVQQELALEYLDIHAASTSGETSLHAACRGGHHMIVEVLLQRFHFQLQADEIDAQVWKLYKEAGLLDKERRETNASLKFDIGALVEVRVEASKQIASQTSHVYKQAVVIAHNYKPKKSKAKTSAPYQVQLLDLSIKKRPVKVSVPFEDELHIRAFNKKKRDLRFAIGAEVMCCTGSKRDIWKKGIVVAHHHSESWWPAGVSAAYQLRIEGAPLDSARCLIFAPLDSDAWIQRMKKDDSGEQDPWPGELAVDTLNGDGLTAYEMVCELVVANEKRTSRAGVQEQGSYLSSLKTIRGRLVDAGAVIDRIDPAVILAEMEERRRADAEAKEREQREKEAKLENDKKKSAAQMGVGIGYGQQGVVVLRAHLEEMVTEFISAYAKKQPEQIANKAEAKTVLEREGSSSSMPENKLRDNSVEEETENQQQNVNARKAQDVTVSSVHVKDAPLASSSRGVTNRPGKTLICRSTL